MTSGPVLFARYAYPPNVLGYCGPDRADDLLDRVAHQADDPDLRRLAQGFEGAWPYLELIAHAAGIADPLDPLVVEAYWIGNHLLDHVDARLLHASMEERFRPRVSERQWSHMTEGVPFESVPHPRLPRLRGLPVGRSAPLRVGRGAAPGARPVPDPVGSCRVRPPGARRRALPAARLGR